VESVHGKGSTFWFSARLGLGTAMRRELVPTLDLRGRRAFVVDDNDHARAVIAEMLEAMTFSVAQASSGAEAVREVQRAAMAGQPYDVVYMDWRMPGMDGIEAARRIRALGLASPPMLLMVTAHGREEVLRETGHAGIDDVLIKPVNPSLLFDTTMGVLGGRRESPARNVAEAVSDDPMVPLRGSRILLVEDNDINQQVARELLEDAGLEVDIADNGEIAVRMVSAKSYDLVFMDMQMPVMDGLAATREIRALPCFASLPIVAMTANAMERDRKRCLDAGMDDFVVKPIDPQALIATLLRWIRPRSPAAAPAARGHAMAGAMSGDMPQGIDGLDTGLGLSRMAGKKTLYVAMLRRYCSGQRGFGQRMGDAIAAGDSGAARLLAHTLKGVSGSVGATAIQELAGALELAIIEEHAATDIQAGVASVQSSLMRLIEALDAQLAAEPA
jgi:two-component system sensor histidine kinase/response regulator